jgi:hypothetical protein
MEAKDVVSRKTESEERDATSRSMGGRLRSRIPELTVEAFSVMLAVLIALGVDEWRENRANQELAATAQANILEEIEGNRDELAGVGDLNTALLERIAGYIEGAESTAADSLSVEFEFALLSTAAWQTAQVTRAAHFLDFDWMSRVARLYNLQELYDRSQTAVVEHMSLGEVPDEELPQFLRTLQARVALVTTLHNGLAQEYADLLAGIDRGGTGLDRPRADGE